MKGSMVAVACLALVFGAAIGLFSTRSHRSGGPPHFQIGAPDDSGGLVLQVMIHEAGVGSPLRIADFEPHPFKDCCSSAAEWALSSDELDGAVVCPDAAERLVGRDGRFEVIGPCVLNSDVYVARSEEVPGKVGVAHKREYQTALVHDRFGAHSTTIPMLPSSLPYALARGLVGGIVVDGLKALSIPEPRQVRAFGGEDVVTYVLVARKELRADPLFVGFAEAYGITAAALNDPDALADRVVRLKGVPWTQKEIDTWKSLNVRFLSPWTADPRPK